MRRTEHLNWTSTTAAGRRRRRQASVLSWLQGRRHIEVWIGATAVRGPLRQRLFGLAASLPPSAPACPNEPPSVLTREQLEAMEKKRPCK
jgi:hypothetical protein